MSTVPRPPRRWMPDDEREECLKCNALFTLFNRKHHCRKCGGLYCHDCSSHMVLLKKSELMSPPNSPLLPDSSHPQRTCDYCIKTLPRQQRPSSSSSSSSYSSVGNTWQEVDCLEYRPGMPYKRYAVTVPVDLRIGQSFQCALDGRIMSVSLPPYVLPGSQILVRAPAAGHGASSFPPPQQTLNCPVCTFENEVGKNSCQMCGESLARARVEQQQQQRRSSEGSSGVSSINKARVLELSVGDPCQQYVIVLPENVGEDEPFQVSLGGRALSLIYPRGAKAGDVIVVEAPPEEDQLRSSFGAAAFGDVEQEAETFKKTSLHAGIVESEFGEDDGGAMMAIAIYAKEEEEEEKEGGEEEEVDTEPKKEIKQGGKPPPDVDEQQGLEGEELASISKQASLFGEEEEVVTHTSQIEEDKVRTAEAEAVNAAIRESLHMTKEQPLLHLHHLLASDSIDDFSCDDGEQKQTPASMAAQTNSFLDVFSSTLRTAAMVDNNGEKNASAPKTKQQQEKELRQEHRKKFLSELAASPPLPPLPPHPSSSSSSSSTSSSSSFSSPTQSLSKKAVMLEHEATPIVSPPIVNTVAHTEEGGCPKCTFKNSLYAPVCAVCNFGLCPSSVASSSSSSKAPQLLPLSAKSEGGGKTAVPITLALAMKMCIVCTLENKPNSSHCEACGEVLPTPSSPSIGSHPSFQSDCNEIYAEAQIVGGSSLYCKVVGSEAVGEREEDD